MSASRLAARLTTFTSGQGCCRSSSSIWDAPCWEPRCPGAVRVPTIAYAISFSTHSAGSRLSRNRTDNSRFGELSRTQTSRCLKFLARPPKLREPGTDVFGISSFSLTEAANGVYAVEWRHFQPYHPYSGDLGCGAEMAMLFRRGHPCPTIRRCQALVRYASYPGHEMHNALLSLKVS